MTPTTPTANGLVILMQDGRLTAEGRKRKRAGILWLDDKISQAAEVLRNPRPLKIENFDLRHERRRGRQAVRTL